MTPFRASLLVFLLSLCALSGCRKPTEDERLHAYYRLPKSMAVNELSISEQLSKEFPKGARFEKVHAFVTKRFGRDEYSTFQLSKDLTRIQTTALYTAYPPQNAPKRNHQLLEAYYEVVFFFDKKKSLVSIRVRSIPLTIETLKPQPKP